MKKFVVFAMVLALAIVALRRFGPTLGRRAMTKCQEMMAKHEGQPGERPSAELGDDLREVASSPA